MEKTWKQDDTTKTKNKASELATTADSRHPTNVWGSKRILGFG